MQNNTNDKTIVSRELERALEDAITSDELKDELERLNEHFFNRKHEGQIRDSILVHINSGKKFRALSEYPKLGAGSVDLTIFEADKQVAAIEFKHHYPKDILNNKGMKLASDLKAILKDVTRPVAIAGLRTTHFVLILQQRTVSIMHEVTNEELIKFPGDVKREYLVSKESPGIVLGPIKYLNRNDDISSIELMEPILSGLKNELDSGQNENGYTWIKKALKPIEVKGGPIESKYVFVLYTFTWPK